MKRHLLVVDDEKSILDIISKVFEAEDTTVACASNGEEAMPVELLGAPGGVGVAHRQVARAPGGDFIGHPDAVGGLEGSDHDD